jgi:hypothetical protein
MPCAAGVAVGSSVEDFVKDITLNYNRNLKLKRLFELVNDAWVQYGNEVFGGITEETRVDMSSVEAWEKAVEDQKE